MRDILTIHFGPDDNKPSTTVHIPNSRPPVDHAHSWYQREQYGFVYWECAHCLATTPEPPSEPQQ